MTPLSFTYNPAHARAQLHHSLFSFLSCISSSFANAPVSDQTLFSVIPHFTFYFLAHYLMFPCPLLSLSLSLVYSPLMVFSSFIHSFIHSYSLPSFFYCYFLFHLPTSFFTSFTLLPTSSDKNKTKLIK